MSVISRFDGNIAMTTSTIDQVIVFIVWPPPGTVLDWFTLLQNNRLVGLVDLDLLFFGVGLGVLIQQGRWRPLAIVSSAVSMALLVLFWNWGPVVGAAINIAILLATWANWPSQALVGS